jgi:hypothetical protein
MFNVSIRDEINKTPTRPQTSAYVASLKVYEMEEQQCTK